MGHSLGAGTAVLVAAELHNSLVDIIGDGNNGGEGSKEPAAAARSVRAMAFACPPVACAALSEAFQRDQVRKRAAILLLSVTMISSRLVATPLCCPFRRRSLPSFFSSPC